MAKSMESRLSSDASFQRDRMVVPSLTGTTTYVNGSWLDGSEKKRIGRRKVNIMAAGSSSPRKTNYETQSEESRSDQESYRDSRDSPSKQQQPKEQVRKQKAKQPAPIRLPHEPSPKQTSHNALSWKSDPSSSFSDWTIEVVLVDEKIDAESSMFYHCHSNVLAWGPRKSEYFVTLFQDRMKQVPPSTLSKIELPMTEAMVFPMLLDFMYCETSLALSADRACALYVLADRMEVTMLMTAIQFFVEKSLNFEQSIEFLSFARRRDDRDKVEKLVLFANSKLCGYLVKHPKDAAKISPDLLAHILNRRAQCIKVLKGEDPRKYSGNWELQRSRLLSVVVSECCYDAIHSDSSNHTLSRQTFQRLINPKHLPAMDSEAALKMLQVDAAVTTQEEKGSADDDTDQVDAMAAMISKQKRKSSSLEDRCLQALVVDWRTIFKRNKRKITETLSQLNPKVLAEMLVMVANQYEVDLAKSQQLTTSRRGHDILDNPVVRDIPRVKEIPAPRWKIDNTTVVSPPCDILEPALTPRYEWCPEIGDLVHPYEEFDDDSFYE
jgi:hypothetical protein